MSHPQAGLQAHTNFTLEKRWGHIDPDTLIAPPKYSADTLAGMILDGTKRKSALTINLEIYEDGTVSPASLATMGAVHKIVRGR